MAVVLVLVQVVGAHEAPYVAFGDGCLERWKIDFVKRAVVNDDVNLVAVLLVVVQREVLNARGDTVGLESLDVGDYHARSKIRVFAHVLEVAATQRGAQYVDTGTENHVLATVEGFLAEGLSVVDGHLRIPRCGKTRKRGEGNARVVGLPGLHPFVPKHVGTDAVGAVVGPEVGHAEACHAGRTELALCMDDGDFLVKGHALEGVFDALFNRLGLVEVYGDGLSHGHRGGEHRENGRCDCLFHYLYYC